MGDRAVIKIHQSDKTQPAIGVYLHWGGETYKGDAARALASARARWDDDQYGTRIIVSSLIAEYADSETGCGLFAQLPGENFDTGPDRPELNVFLGTKTVEVDGHETDFDKFIDFYN